MFTDSPSIVLAFFALAVLATGCSTRKDLIPAQIAMTPTPAPTITPEPRPNLAHPSDLGVVEILDRDKMCFVTRNSWLDEGEKITAIFPRPPQIVAEFKIVGGACNREGMHLLMDEVSEYRIEFTSGRKVIEQVFKRDDFAGVGVLGATSRPRVVGGLAMLDVDGDDRPEYFRECTGIESFHLTIWRGIPLKSDRIWHAAYYFEYDTVPTCKGYEGTSDPY